MSIPSKRKLDSQPTQNQNPSLKRTTKPRNSTTNTSTTSGRALVNTSGNKSRGGGGGRGKELNYEDEIDSGGDDQQTESAEIEQTKRLLKSMLDKKERGDREKLEGLKRKVEKIFKETNDTMNALFKSRLTETERVDHFDSNDLIDDSPLTAEYFTAVFEEELRITSFNLETIDEIYQMEEDTNGQDDFWNEAAYSYEQRPIEVKRQLKKLRGTARDHAQQMIEFAQLNTQAALVASKNMKATLKH